MHDLAVARPELDGRDRPVRIDRNRNHEAAIDVAPLGRHLEWLGGLENQVGSAELPALGKPRWRLQVLRVALGSSRPGPVGDPADLLLAQRPLVMKRAKVRLGLPGGHLPARGDLRQVACPLGGVAIGQRARTDRSRPAGGSPRSFSRESARYRGDRSAPPPGPDRPRSTMLPRGCREGCIICGLHANKVATRGAASSLSTNETQDRPKSFSERLR